MALSQRYRAAASREAAPAPSILTPHPRPEAALDNLTHALVGAAISKAGAERTTPLATATLVLAANAPDIDVLSYVRGPYFALSFRRGITHGWPALVMLPFLVTVAILMWDRFVRRRKRPTAAPVRAGPTLVLATVGVLTHPTLDWMNTYGMRWSLPFDGAWSYGDALFILDPWIWLTLGGAVFLAVSPARRGLVAWAALGGAASIIVLAGIPAARLGWMLGLGLIVWLHRALGSASPERRRAFVATATALVTAYIGGLLLMGRAAENDVRLALRAAGITSTDVMVSPVRGTPMSSNVVVLTDAGYVQGSHRWFRSPRVQLSLGAVVPLVARPGWMSGEALAIVIAEARAVRVAHDYLVWSRYPYVVVAPDPGTDAWRIRFADARYLGEVGAGGLAGVDVRVARSPPP